MAKPKVVNLMKTPYQSHQMSLFMRTLYLSSLDVLHHCVQNLTLLKLSLFLNYSTYFPKLVAPLFSPICFVASFVKGAS